MGHLDLSARARSFAGDRAASAVFLDAGRRRIVTDLVVHVSEGAGPMLLVGETGSGKTILLQRVAEEAAMEGFPVVAAAATAGASSLLAIIARFEARPRDDQRRHQPKAAEPNPAGTPVSPADRPAAILIDDADECPVAVWYKLAGVLRSDRQPLALPPMVLAMAPEMLAWLEALGLLGTGPSADRIRRIAPLTPADIGRYIGRRLNAIDHPQPDLFPAATNDLIAAATAGLPGRINRLCDEVLTMASVRGGSRVSTEVIETALAGIAASPVAPAAALGGLAGTTAATSATAASADQQVPLNAAHLWRKLAETEFGETPADTPSAGRRDAMPSSPPEYGGAWQQGSRRRSRRGRPGWLKIAAACSIALVAAIAAGTVLHAQRSHNTVAAVPAERPPADRPGGLTVPGLQAEMPAPHASPPPADRSAADDITDRMPAWARSTSPPDNDEASFAKSAPTLDDDPGLTKTQPPAAKRSSQPLAQKPIPAPPRAAASKATASAAKAAAPAAPPPPATANAGEGGDPEDPSGPARPVAEIIAMGDAFRASGDVAWARKFYSAAQERGSAKAAKALAETYDPRHVDSGDRPDPQVARQLYEQAARRGDRGAAKQLGDLDQWLNDEGDPAADSR